jgi:hypothetical protein
LRIKKAGVGKSTGLLTKLHGRGSSPGRLISMRTIIFLHYSTGLASQSGLSGYNEILDNCDGVQNE